MLEHYIDNFIEYIFLFIVLETAVELSSDVFTGI